MKENVGRLDQVGRAFLGPALIALGMTALGASRGRIVGLATVVAGVLVLESGITRVCPVSHVAGVDTKALEEELLEAA